MQLCVSAASCNARRDFSRLAPAVNGRLRLFSPALRDICVDGIHLREQNRRSNQAKIRDRRESKNEREATSGSELVQPCACQVNPTSQVFNTPHYW